MPNNNFNFEDLSKNPSPAIIDPSLVDRAFLDNLKKKQPQSGGTPITETGNMRRDVNANEFESYMDADILMTQTTESYWNEMRAQDQNLLALSYKGLWNGMVEVATGTLEGASYLLDLEQHINTLNGTEKEFGNWFGDVMKGVKEDLSATVYQTEDAQTGFAPLDATYWASNAPSIASAISLLIPTQLAVGGLTKGARLLGVTNKMKALGMAPNLVKGFTGAVISRYMENTMEASQTFEKLKRDALNKGLSEENANKVAGTGAANTWYANWANLVWDIGQYSTIFGGFQKGKIIKNLLTNSVQEGAEEGGQFIVQKESERHAKQAYGLDPKDATTFTERLKDYVQDPEFKSSVLLGAVGGGAMSGFSEIQKFKERSRKDKQIGSFNTKAEQYKAAMENDEDGYTKASDNAFVASTFKHADANTFSVFRSDMVEMMSTPKDILKQSPNYDPKDFHVKLAGRLQDLDFAESQHGIIGKEELPKEIKGFKLGLVMGQRFAERRIGKINNDIAGILAEDTRNNNFDTRLVELKRLYAIVEATKGKEAFKDENIAAKLEIRELQKAIKEDKSLPTLTSVESIKEHISTSMDSSLNAKMEKFFAEREELADIREKIKQTADTKYQEQFTKEQADKKEAEAKAEAKEADTKEEAAKDAAQAERKASDKDVVKDAKDNTVSVTPEERAANPYFDRVDLAQTAEEVNKVVMEAMKDASMMTEKLDQYAQAAHEALSGDTTNSVEELLAGFNKPRPATVVTQAAVNEAIDSLPVVDGMDVATNVAVGNDPITTSTISKGLTPNEELISGWEGDTRSSTNEFEFEFTMVKGKRVYTKVNRLSVMQYDTQGNPVTTGQETEINFEFKDRVDTLPAGTKLRLSAWLDSKYMQDVLKENPGILEHADSWKGLHVKIEAQNEKGEWIVVGQLRDYRDNETTEEAANESLGQGNNALALLRKHIFRNYKTNNEFFETVKTKTVGFPYINKARDEKGVLTTVHSPAYLLFGKESPKYATGDNNSTIIDNTGKVYGQGTKGAVYAIVKHVSGPVPVRLHTRTLNTAEIESIIKSLRNLTEDNYRDTIDIIRETMWNGKNSRIYITGDSITYREGNTKRTVKTKELSDEALTGILSKQYIRINQTLLNTAAPFKGHANYNVYLESVNALTTELNPLRPFYGSIIVMEPPVSIKEHVKNQGQPKEKRKDKPSQDYQGPVLRDLPDLKKELTQDVIFFPQMYTTVMYDSSIKNWIIKVDEDAQIGGEKSFKKDGWTYVYAPWLDEPDTDEEGNTTEGRAYSRYKISEDEGYLKHKTEYLTQAQYNQEKGELDDDPFSVKLLTWEEAKRYWENYKRSLPPEFTGPVFSNKVSTGFTAVEEEAFIRRRLPLAVHDLDMLKRIKYLGSGVQGAFYNASIYLYKNAEKGTGYHEAFHAVYRLYLTDKQRDEIYQEAKKRFGTPNTSDLASLVSVYPNATDEQIVALFYEEKMADEFMNYVISNGEKKVRGKIGVFFKQLLDFIRSIFGKKLTLNELFDNINTGVYQDANIVRNTDKFAEDVAYRVIDGFTPMEQRRRVDSITFRVFTALKKLRAEGKIKEYTDVSSEELKSIFADIRQGFQETVDEYEGQEALAKVLNRWEEFVSKSIESFEQLGYSVSDEAEDFITNDTPDTEETKERIYNKEFFTENLKKSLSKEIRLFLNFIPKTDRNGASVHDDLGELTFVKGHDLYAYIAKHTTNLDSLDEMIAELKELTPIRPELVWVTNHLENPSTPVNDINKFFTTFSNQQLNFVTITNKGFEGDRTFEVYETNRRSLGRRIVSEWKASYLSENNTAVSFDSKTGNLKIDLIAAKKLKGEYVSVLKGIENNKLDDSQAQVISSILHKIGITLNPLALKTAIENANDVALYLTGSRSIMSILNTFAEGNDIFATNTEKKGEANAINLLSKIELTARVDETVESFLNGENNIVFSINRNTALSKSFRPLLDEATSVDKINEIFKDAYLNPEPSGQWANSWLKQLRDNPEVRKEAKVYIFDTERYSSRGDKGTAFNNINDYLWERAKINLLLNQGNKFGYFSSPTPADKPNTFFVRFLKHEAEVGVDGKLKGRSYNELYKMFMQEAASIKQANAEIKTLPAEELVDGFHTNIEGMAKKGTKFQIFKNFNEPLGERVWDADSIPDIFNNDDTRAIRAELLDWFNREYSQELENLIDLNIIERTETGDLINKEIDKRVLLSDEFGGDLTKVVKSYVLNTIIGYNGITAITSGNPAFYKSEDDITKRYALWQTPGTDVGKDGYANIAIANDIKGISDEVIASIKKALGSLGMRKDAIDKIVNEYRKTTVTDAQGLTTLARYIDIRKRQGEWSKKEDSALADLLAGKPTAESINLLISPVKGTYIGQRTLSNGRIVPVVIKYSTIPLIPAVTAKFPVLENLRKHMENPTTSMDELVFRSGWKVGAQAVGDISDLSTLKPLKVSNDIYRIPLVNPYKEKYPIFATQIRWHILSNIDEATKYKIGKDPLTGKEVIEQFNKLITDNLKEDYHSTVERLKLANFEKITKQNEVIGNFAKPSIVISDLVNHSGGAKGGDMVWDTEGRKIGVTKHNHYTVDYFDKLSEKEKQELDKQYLEAVKFLNRGVINKASYPGRLVRRDMLQANKGDAVFGITELVKSGIKGRKGYVNKASYSIPEGGTGYAVARGIILNKPTYVFNQSNAYGNEIGWYIWDIFSNDFIKTDTPILTKNFTGIGSQEINDTGKQAIWDVYNKTKEFSGSEGSSHEEIAAAKAEVVRLRTETNEALHDILIDEVDKRGNLPESYEKALDINAEGYFNIPLDFPLLSRKYENMLFSVFKNKVVKQTLPGMTGINVSEYGYSEENGDTLKYFEPEYDAENNITIVKECEIYVSQDYFKNTLGREVTSEEFKSWPESAKRGIAYRIPNQGKNFIIHFVIKDILPKEAAQQIILPKAFVTQVGLDFDIDKMFIVLPHLEITDDKVDVIKYADGLSRKERDNRILEIFIGILSNPAHYKELVTPNSSAALEEALKAVQRAAGKSTIGKSWYSLKFQRESRRLNQAGKQLVGVYSNHSVGYIKMQLIKPESYGISFLFNNEAYSSIVNTDNNNVKITDIGAEHATAAVDNANKPILGGLNDSTYIAPIRAMMSAYGVDVNTAALFFAQPILVEFSKLYALGGSDYKASQEAIEKLVVKYTGLANTGQVGLSQHQFWLNNTLLLKCLETLGKPLSAATGMDKSILDTPDVFAVSSESKEAAIKIMVDGFNTVGKEVYKIYAKQYHPDTENGDTELMQVINNMNDEFKKYGSVNIVNYIQDKALLTTINTDKYYKFDPYVYQLKVLDSFIKYKRYATHYNDIITTLAADSLVSGLSSTVSENTAWIKKHERLTQPIDIIIKDNKGFGIDLASAIGKLEMITAFTEYGIKLPTGLLSNLFAWGTPLFTEVRGYIEKATGIVLGPDALESINYNLFNFIFTLPSSPLYLSPTDKKDMLFGSNALADRVAAFRLADKKGLIKDNNYDLNKFIDNLYIEKGDTMNVIKFNNTNGSFTPDQKTELSDYWLRLFNTPETSQLAVDLLKYSVLSNGFVKGPSSFIDLVPVGLLNSLGVDTWYNKLRGEFSDAGYVDSYLFMDQYLRNHAYDNLLVPKVKVTKGEVTELGVSRLNTDQLLVDLTTNARFLAYKEGYDEYFKPFIKISNRDSLELYKFDGWVGDKVTGQGLYTRVELLGNGAITEYSVEEAFPKSVLPENKFDAFSPLEEASTKAEDLFGSKQDEQEFFELAYDRSEIEAKLRQSPAIQLTKKGEYRVVGTRYAAAISVLAGINRAWKNSVRTVKRTDGKTYVVINDSPEMFQLDAEKQERDQSLDMLLKQRLAAIGVKVTSVDEIRTRTGRKAVAVANLTKKVIQVANGASLNTLPEEAGHFFVAALGEENPIYKALYEDVVHTETYKQVKAEYSEEYEGNETKIRFEAIGKLLGQAIVSKHIEASKPFYKRIMARLKAFIDRVLQLFKRGSIETINQDVKDVYGDLAASILANDLTPFNSENIGKGEFYQLGQKLITVKAIIEHKITALKARAAKYKAYGKPEYAKNIEEFIKTLKDLEQEEAFTKLLTQANFDLGKIQERLNDSTLDVSGVQRATEMVSAYAHIDKFYDDVTPETAKLATEVETLRQKLEARLNTEQHSILSVVMKTITTNPGKHFLNVLESQRDISGDQRYLGAIASSNDTLLALTDKIYKRSVAKANEDSLEFVDKHSKLIAAVLASEKNFDFMLQRNTNGLHSGFVVTKYSSEYHEAMVFALRVDKDETDNARKQRIANFFKKYHKQRESLGERTEPKDMYIDPKWSRIQATPVLKAYYDFYKETIDKTDEQIPVGYRRSTKAFPGQNEALPVYRKHFIESINKDGLKLALKGLSKSYAESWDYTPDIKTVVTDESGKVVTFLKVYGASKPQPERMSFDVPKILNAYVHMGNMYEAKSGIRDLMDLISDVITKRKVPIMNSDGTQQVDSEGNFRFKEGKESQVVKRFEDWHNMVYLDNPSKDTGSFNVFGKQVGKQRIAGALLSYSSLKALALNLFAGINNVTLGNITNMIEAAGGEFYTIKDYLWAGKEYGKEMGIYFGKSSKLKLMLGFFDVMQDTKELEGGESVASDKAKMLYDLPFIFNKAGEHFLQGRMFMAMANNRKVKGKDGTEVSLWEAFEVVDGVLSLKDNFKNSDISDFATRNDFRQQVKGINQKLHGRYTAEEAAAIQQYALGKLAMQFRKWIHAGYEARFRKRYYDERLMSDVKGRWLSYGDFFKMIFKHKGNMVAGWSTMNSMDRANMRRNTAELVYFAIVVTLYSVLASLGEDDDDLKKNKAFNFTKYQADRLVSETLFYISPADFMKILRSPAASLSTIENLIETFIELGKFPFVEEEKLIYQRGPFKDQYKLEKQFEDLVPIWKEANRWISLEDGTQHYKK